MRRLRSHITYANVTATMALFIALGGTSYAVTQLPRNSVGAKQLRSGAVGGSDIKTGAVRSRHIGNRSIAVRDVSLSTRRSLQGRVGPVGPQGPPGPSPASLSASVLAGGNFARSRGTPNQIATHTVAGVYRVDFTRDVSQCYPIATIAGNSAGLISSETASGAPNSVNVYTRDTAGNPSDRAFHLIVSC